MHDLKFSNDSFPHFGFGFNVDDLAEILVSICFHSLFQNDVFDIPSWP